MKYIVYGTTLLAMTILVLAGVMIVSGKDVRENEMDKALNTAVEQALEQLKKDRSYEIKNQEELIADFQQSLLMNISSDSQVEVKILTADIEKGVLDVEVLEEYETVNGAKKQAICRKTVILEQYTRKGEYCIVEFLVDGKLYEKYSIYQGSKVVLPVEPKETNRVFRGWKDIKSKEWLSEELSVEKNMVFEAVFQ